MRFRTRILGIHRHANLLAAAMTLAAIVIMPDYASSQVFLIDKNHPECSNKGPGNESKPWCNLWGLNGRRFNPGSVVLIKAGDYVGNEDPSDPHLYHHAVSIYAGGTREAPFTLKAWPGDAGEVRIYAAGRDAKYAFLFWGSHIRIHGLTFIGHVELPEGRLYSPNVIRFAVTDEPVNDIHFDSVRVLHFQGAQDLGLGCRRLHRPPVGECSITRPSEGWGRGIELAETSNVTFENGEITCTDEAGKVGLEEIRAQGLFLGADGAKATGCSNLTFRNNVFYACGHNNLGFACDSVLVENNYFENELHRSVGFTEGTGNIVRYNTFAAFEERRTELREADGNAIQLRTSNSKVHHNLFYGGGEPNHQGALHIAALRDFVVGNNEIFSNVTLALNSMSFSVNDKFEPPFNLQNNKVYNNIFIGKNTENGVFRWNVESREAYFAGETFGNEFRNNIIFSLTEDPAILSFKGWRSPIPLSEEEFNGLAVASDNIVADPGLADLNFDNPDFHIRNSCIAINAGLPVEVTHDFDGNPIANEGERPTIGPYVAGFTRLDPPHPEQPVDSQTGVPAYAAFGWSPTDEAERYHLQVSADSSFNSPVFDEDGLETTLFLAQEPLPYSETFYWRVRVSAARGVSWPESAGCTPWGPSSAFTIAVGTGAEKSPDLPLEFGLSYNYPNPFASSTTITYSVPGPVEAEVTVFDALGRVAAELANGRVEAGRHQVEWRAQGMVSGPYFYRLRAGDFEETKVMLVMR